MANQSDIPTKRRLNVTITNGDVADIEELRALLEKRLLQRLSIAQVIKRMTRRDLAIEQALASVNK